MTKWPLPKHKINLFKTRPVTNWMMSVFFSNQKTPVCNVFTALHANASLMPSSYEEIYKDQFFWSTKVSVSYGFVCVVLPLFKLSKCK